MNDMLFDVAKYQLLTFVILNQSLDRTTFGGDIESRTSAVVGAPIGKPIDHFFIERLFRQWIQ